MDLSPSENKVGNTPRQGSEEEISLLDRMRKCLREARTYVSKWREQAEECDNYYHGHQWSEDDVALMRAQRRPPLTFNRIKPFINSVVGFEIQNRQKCIFIPRHPDMTPQVAATELATDAIDWAFDQCNGHDERSYAFLDMMVRGMGWTEKRIDIEADDDGMFVSERVDGFEMYWDQTSRKRNLEDAKWMARRRWVRQEDVEALWPAKKDLMAANASEAWDSDALDMPSVVERKMPELYMSDGTKYRPGMPGIREQGYILVTDFQWKERQKRYTVIDPLMPQNETMLSEKEWNTLKRRATTFVVKSEKTQWVYRRAFVAGDVVLEISDLPVDGGFTFACMTYIWDTKDKLWYGLTRVLLDPQRGANKWFSQALHIFNTSPKGTVFVESSAIVNPAKLADQLSSPNPIVQVRDGAISQNRIKIEQPGGLAPATTQLIQYAVGAFKDVSGINIEMLGMSEGNQPGITMRQRQTQGIAILALAFQALTRFRIMEARQSLKWLRDHLADGRWIRIGGAYNSRAVQLVKDPLMVEYDVIVDENPNNPSTKIEVWELLQPIIPVLIRNGLFIPELLDYAPLPASIVASIKMQMQKREQAMEQAPQQAASKDPREIQANIERTQAQTQLAMARADAIRQSSQIDGADAAENDRQSKENHQVNLAKATGEMFLKGRAQALQERAADRADDQHRGQVAQSHGRHAADIANLINDMALARRKQHQSEQESYQERLDDPNYGSGD